MPSVVIPDAAARLSWAGRVSEEPEPSIFIGSGGGGLGFISASMSASFSANDTLLGWREGLEGSSSSCCVRSVEVLGSVDCVALEFCSALSEVDDILVEVQGEGSASLHVDETDPSIRCSSAIHCGSFHVKS